MITARKPVKRINLLPQEEFAASLLGRVLKWLLSTFRVIVIATEIAVMAAFLSRFWLDAKANDLNDSIRQRQAVISTTSDFENEFRNLQKKLEIFSKTVKARENPSGVMENITSYLPEDISLNSIQITQGSIQLRGTSASESAIAQFIVNLKSNSDFKKVLLAGISSSQQNRSLIVFTIKIDYSK